MATGLISLMMFHMTEPTKTHIVTSLQVNLRVPVQGGAKVTGGHSKKITTAAASVSSDFMILLKWNISNMNI